MHESEQLIEIAAGAAKLEAILSLPEGATGMVLFAHGIGSGRLSPRNVYTARVLKEAGFATLLMDLLMVDEAESRSEAPDTDLLAQRILIATEWLEENSETRHLPVGYFGADTGAGAVLMAAGRAGIEGAIPITGEPGPCAVVCRGGRTELAGPYLPYVKTPTLLVVGGRDEAALACNREAYEQLKCEKDLVIIPEASHLFEETGTLEMVAELAAAWFKLYLKKTCL
jgi:putative phosphoribosyl transferase